MTNRATGFVMFMLTLIRRGFVVTGNGMPCSSVASHDIANALLAWQKSGDEVWLEHVIVATLPRLEHAARSVLRRLHISDWSAVDDALSLVLDHLRRLPATTPGERAVRRFEMGRGTGHGSGDPGLAYLVWLAHERAFDVARQRKRQVTRRMRFKNLGHVPYVDDTGIDTHANADEIESDATARMHDALPLLEPRSRTVVELLLDGKSQAVIAHVLGVCEGTVSRLRTRAIAELRRLLA
jgi:RNA polymerase sigma factor (sigma-70 family)